MKITHIITGLNTGGAEMMLFKLLAHSPKDVESEVISLTDIGPVGKKIQELGVSVRSLGMSPGFPNPLLFFKLLWMLRKSSPNIVQTWLHHADVIGGIASKLSHPKVPVVWNLRYSKLDPSWNKPTTVLMFRLGSLLSHLLPKRIICVSESALKAHEKIGYEKKKMLTIPNGFDLDLFYPDSKAGVSLRKEIGISEDAFLIGMVARFDPFKDHKTLILAADQLAQKHDQVHFVLCGRGVSWENRTLKKWVEETKFPQRFHLLGEREDIPRILSSLDIATLSSVSEGFPNVLGEAMACGIPCVATDAGDAFAIIGEAGIVVPVWSPKALAQGWRAILEMSPEKRGELGKKARERILSEFSLKKVAAQYYNLYRDLCLRT